MRDTAVRQAVRVLLYALVIPAQVAFVALCLHMATPLGSLGA